MEPATGEKISTACSLPRPRPETLEAITSAFKKLDMNDTGRISRTELRCILLECRDLRELDVDGLLDAITQDADGTLSYQHVLNWVFPSNDIEPSLHMTAEEEHTTASEGCNVPAKATDRLHCMEIRVLAVSGKEVCKFQASATDLVDDVKRKIRQYSGPPSKRQQLLRDGCLLEDGKSLLALGITEDNVLLQLVRLQPPPLQEGEFEQVVAEKYASMKDLSVALEELFEDRDVNAQLRVPPSEDSDEEGCKGDIQDAAAPLEDDSCATACGTPLWKLAHTEAPSDQLTHAASWLLARGARADLKHPPEGITWFEDWSDDLKPQLTVMEEYLSRRKAGLVRALLSSGVEWPTISSLLYALPEDHSFCPSHSAISGACRWNPLSEQLRRLESDIARAEEFQDFTSLLKTELLPAVRPLPASLLSQQFGTITGCPCDDTKTVLHHVLDNGGRGWALSLLLHHGAQWCDLPSPPPLEDETDFRHGECPSEQELHGVAGKLEALLALSIISAKTSTAIWRGDVAEVRRLLAECEGDPSWARLQSNSGVSLLVDSVRAGGNTDILDLLLSDHRLDPNPGLYEYGWHGSFQLWSALGWIAENGQDYLDPNLLQDLIQRLASHPRCDPKFGKIEQGERPSGTGRQACAIGSALHMFQRHWNLFGVLALLRAGAPIPLGKADPLLAANGGAWGSAMDHQPSEEVYEGSPQSSWLSSFELQLQDFLQSCQTGRWSVETVDVSEEELQDAVVRAKADLSRVKQNLMVGVECNGEAYDCARQNGEGEEGHDEPRMDNARFTLQYAIKELHRYQTKQKNIDSVAQLLQLISRVRSGFRVNELMALPVPDKLVSRALSQWRGDGSNISCLPSSAHQIVLSFLPLWASSLTRAELTCELCLGCIDIQRHWDRGRPLRDQEVAAHRLDEKIDKWWNGEFHMEEQEEEEEETQ